jgi:photosystem II stability/assembly factor-like uncharacterized protein
MMAHSLRRVWLPAVSALLLGAAVLLALFLPADGTSTLADNPTRSSNALLVHRVTAERLLLGTDDGALESLDGGQSWRGSGLEGREVVALARLKDGTIWAGGNGFLARSSDGGRSWTDVRPSGLPSLDVRALSASRDVSGRLEAAIGGEGLFRSNDGGQTFGKLGLASHVGSEARALVETIDGVIVVSDERRGVVANCDGDGVEWIDVLGRSPSSLAPNYGDRYHALLLARTNDGVFRTTNKGQTWVEVLPLGNGSGPVAFSQSRVELAYALAADGTAYRSTDFGATWTATG